MSQYEGGSLFISCDIIFVLFLRVHTYNRSYNLLEQRLPKGAESKNNTKTDQLKLTYDTIPI